MLRRRQQQQENPETPLDRGFDHKTELPTMALNLLLLAFAPEITGTDTAAKLSRLRRLYDFIVTTQTRRAEYEVARYLRQTRPDSVPLS